jgi:hypothetical protein
MWWHLELYIKWGTDQFCGQTIKTTDKLSKICEQLFTRLLPPIMSTKGIVGKDNITYMIVKFERNNQKKDRFQRIHFWEFEIYLFSKSKPKKKLESHPNLFVVFNRQLSYRIKDFFQMISIFLQININELKIFASIYLQCLKAFNKINYFYLNLFRALKQQILIVFHLPNV